MRLNRHTQEKLHDILLAQGFTIRYEKGNFKGGHCVVMEQRVIIINKFYPMESKVQTLMDIIREIDIEEEQLEPEQLKTLQKLKE